MGVLSRQYYAQLEKEAEEDKKVSQYLKMNSSVSNLYKKIGLSNPLALIGLAGLSGNEKIRHNISNFTYLDDATVHTLMMLPMLTMKLQSTASMVAPQLKQEYASLAQNNFRDYGVGTMSRHAARSLYRASTAASLGLIGEGTLSGSEQMINLGLHLNPFSLLFKGASGAGHLLGNLTGNPLFGTLGTAAAIFGLGKYVMPKLVGSIASPKASNRISIPQMTFGKITDLLNRSTYRKQMQNILMMQNMQILKPGEALIAGILNDINLNTSALLPMYEKQFGNIKEVQNAQTADNLANMFNNDQDIDEFDENFTKKDYKKRKANFHFLAGIELAASELIYKTFGNFLMEKFTGKSYKDFLLEKDQYKEAFFGGKIHAMKYHAKRLNVTPSGINVLTKSAEDFLQAPDYESRMLGLTAGIFELNKIIALQSFGKKGSNLYEDINNLSNIYNYGRKDNNSLSSFGIIGSLLSLLYNFSIGPVIGKGFDKIAGVFSPVAAERSKKGILERYVENFSELKDKFNIFKSIKNLIYESFGTITNKDLISSTFESEKQKLLVDFDKQKSAFDYLGTHFPDDMTNILKELKQQTIYLEDLLTCQNCSARKSTWSRNSWRGAFGAFMNEKSFMRKVAQETFKNTKEFLGIENKYLNNGFFSRFSPLNIAAKIFKVKDKDLNQDREHLIDLYKNELANSYFAEDYDNYQTKAEIKHKIKDRRSFFQKLKESAKNIKGSITNVTNTIISRTSTPQQERENHKLHNLISEQFLIQKKQLKELEQLNSNFKCYLSAKNIACSNGLGIAQIQNFNKPNEDDDGGILGTIGWFGKKFLGWFKKGLDLLKSKTNILWKPVINFFKNKSFMLKKVGEGLFGVLIGTFIFLKDKAKEVIDKFKNFFHFSKKLEETPKKLPQKIKSSIKPEKPKEISEIKQTQKEAIKEIEKKTTIVKKKTGTQITKTVITKEKEGLLKKFFRIATKKLLARFDAAFVKKLMLRLSTMAAGFFAGPIGWIWDVVNALSLGWLIWDVAGILFDAWHEANNQPEKSVSKQAEKVVEKTIQGEKTNANHIAGGHAGRYRHRFHSTGNELTTPSTQPSSSTNTTSSNNQDISKLSEAIIEMSKIQATMLAQLNKLMNANVKINSEILNQVAQLSTSPVSITPS